MNWWEKSEGDERRRGEFVEEFGENVALVVERESRMDKILEPWEDKWKHMEVWKIIAIICDRENNPTDWYTQLYIPSTDWRLEIQGDSAGAEFKIDVRHNVMFVEYENGYKTYKTGRKLETSLNNYHPKKNIHGLWWFHTFCDYIKDKMCKRTPTLTEYQLRQPVSSIQFRRALYKLYQSDVAIVSKVGTITKHMIEFFTKDIQKMIKTIDVKTLFDLALAGDRTAATISASDSAWRWMFERDYPNEFAYFEGQVPPYFLIEKYASPMRFFSDAQYRFHRYDPPWKRVYLHVRKIYKAFFNAHSVPPGSEDDNQTKRAVVWGWNKYYARHIGVLLFRYYVLKGNPGYTNLQGFDSKQLADHTTREYFRRYLHVQVQSDDVQDWLNEVVRRARSDETYRNKHEYFLVVFFATQKGQGAYNRALIRNGLEYYKDAWKPEDADFLKHVSHIMKTRSLIAIAKRQIEERGTPLMFSKQSTLKWLLDTIIQSDVYKTSEKPVTWFAIADATLPEFTPKIALDIFPFAGDTFTRTPAQMRTGFIHMCVRDFPIFGLAPRDNTGKLILSCISCTLPNPQFTCSNCKNVHYCDIDCQKQHWLNGHSIECRISSNSTVNIY